MWTGGEAPEGPMDGMDALLDSDCFTVYYYTDTISDIQFRKPLFGDSFPSANNLSVRASGPIHVCKYISDPKSLQDPATMANGSGYEKVLELGGSQ